jgi:hypothetical protein
VEHVVFFPAPDGAPAFHRVASLEDAVRLVEHLRNVEGVSEVSVHPLGAEVPLAFRAWYRVEVPTAQGATAPAAGVEAPAAGGTEPVAVEPKPTPVAVVPEQSTAPEPAGPAGVEEPVLAEASQNGHGKDAVPSLGFFA